MKVLDQFFVPSLVIIIIIMIIMIITIIITTTNIIICIFVIIVIIIIIELKKTLLFLLLSLILNFLGSVKEQIGRNINPHALLPNKARQMPTVLRIIISSSK